MNDNELDDLLDQWTAPPMRESLREELRTGFAAAPKRARRTRARRIIDAIRRIRIGRIAVAGIAAAALLFGIIQVFPKTARMASNDFRIPFYVEFEFTRYDRGKPAPHTSRITTFPYAGYEINMSVTEFSGNWAVDTFREIASSIRDQMVLVAPSLVLPKGPPMAEPAWFAGFVNSGCSSGKKVVGHETIAGHVTTVVESQYPRGRFRHWLAPDLSCFDLKLTYEIVEPDGTYRLEHWKEARKVTVIP